MNDSGTHAEFGNDRDPRKEIARDLLSLLIEAAPAVPIGLLHEVTDTTLDAVEALLEIYRGDWRRP